MKLRYLAAGCTISDNEKHRFSLHRSWARRFDEEGLIVDPLGYYRALIFIMLNPSTADGLKDDPTIKSCVRIANYHGYGHILVGNLWSYRATDWKQLRTNIDIANTERSNEMLVRLFSTPGEFLQTNYLQTDVVFAWGSRVMDIEGAAQRIAEVTRLYKASPLGRKPARCLGRTQSGNPNHPLFIAAATPLQAYQ